MRPNPAPQSEADPAETDPAETDPAAAPRPPPGAPFFSYRDGQLQAEGVPLDRIAAAVDTPAFIYSQQAVLAAAAGYRAALQGLPATICYAMKANANGALLRLLARDGLGCDVVSGGEMTLALKAGFPPGRIVFSGVGKTEREITAALDAGIAHLNVESESELAAIARIAAAKSLRAPILLRVNPDVAAATHEKIATGHKATKFGIAWDGVPALYARAAADPALQVLGLAAHIGSQITSLAPYRIAFARLASMVDDLRSGGLTVQEVDLGGGLGIRYRDEAQPDMAAFGALVREQFGSRDVKLLVEPGRSLVGNAGVLLTRVIHVKRSADRVFAIVDAAMNDLIRPTLYEAWHEILPVTAAGNAGTGNAATGGAAEPPVTVDVVGPVCESGDFLARGRTMAVPVAGSLLAVMSAGAYASVMSSTYNARPLAAEVLVDGDRFAVVRRRQTLAEMTALDSLPPWLDPPAPNA